MKTRFNKQAPKREERKEVKENPEVAPVNCHICGTQVSGAYGWSDLHEKGVVASCCHACELLVSHLRDNRYVF